MTRLSSPGLWYLFDYGMVISTAPEPEDWQALRRATGADLDLQAASSPYWRHREEFDGGTLTPEQYWSRVLGRAAGADEVRTLEALDAAAWSHLNATTLGVVETLREEGAQLALLSNMPAAMSRHYAATSPWPGHFSRLYFSGQLRMRKPDPRIFEHVAADLSVQPRDIVFVDDNPANISTARHLGFQTVLHTPETDLEAELTTVPR